MRASFSIPGGVQQNAVMLEEVRHTRDPKKGKKCNVIAYKKMSFPEFILQLKGYYLKYHAN